MPGPEPVGERRGQWPGRDRGPQQVVSGERVEIQQPENSRAAGKFESGARKSK